MDVIIVPTLERIQLSKWTVGDRTYTYYSRAPYKLFSLAMQQITNLKAIIENYKHNIYK